MDVRSQNRSIQDTDGGESTEGAHDMSHSRSCSDFTIVREQSRRKERSRSRDQSRDRGDHSRRSPIHRVDEMQRKVLDTSCDEICRSSTLVSNHVLIHQRGMSPEPNGAIHRVSRSKSPAVTYVDRALNGRCDELKVSINLVRGRKKCEDTDGNSNVDKSRNRNGNAVVRGKSQSRSSSFISSTQRIRLHGDEGRYCYPDHLRQRRLQRDIDLRNLKLEIAKDVRDRNTRSHEDVKSCAHVVERHRPDGDDDILPHSSNVARKSRVGLMRNSKRAGGSYSGSDVLLSEDAKEAAKEFNSDTLSLPASTPKTPKSPDDWQKSATKVAQETHELPFDTIEFPTKNSTLPFKASDESRSIVCRASNSLSIISPPPPPPPPQKNRANPPSARNPQSAPTRIRDDGEDRILRFSVYNLP